MHEVADHFDVVTRHHLAKIRTKYKHGMDGALAYHLLSGIRSTLGPGQRGSNIGGADK